MVARLCTCRLGRDLGLERCRGDASCLFVPSEVQLALEVPPACAHLGHFVNDEGLCYCCLRFIPQEVEV